MPLSRLKYLVFLSITTLFFFAINLPAQSQVNEASTTLSADDKAVLSKFADLLEDGSQRTVVIEQLRSLADHQSTTAVSGNLASEKEEESTGELTGLSQHITEQSAEVTGQVNSKLQATFLVLIDVLHGDFSQLGDFDKAVVFKTLKNMAILLLLSIIFYQTVRFASRLIKKRLNHWSLEGIYRQPIIRRIIATLLTFCLDGLFVAVSYFLIRGIAAFVLGDVGAVSMQADIFIKAFLYVEVIKLFVRLLLYPRFSGLRLFPGDESIIKYWNRWICNIINFVGYGFLLLIPLIESYWKNEVMAQVLATIIALVTFFYGIWGVVRHRKIISQRLKNIAIDTRSTVIKSFLYFLAAIWHYLAIIYFTMLAIVMIVWTNEALPFVLKGTAETIAIVVLGLLVSGLLTSIIEKGIKLPNAWNEAIPGLNRKINTYIPILLKILKFILVLSVVLFVFSVWNIIDFPAWLNSDSGSDLVHRWSRVLWIWIIATIVWIVVSSFIEGKLNPSTNTKLPSARAQTLLSLTKNALSIFVIAVAIMMSLSQIGINIGPLIAGAGVFGLAIGFGAQTLVKDVITGIFIQLENAINKGDYVTASGVSGTAERITIRSVALRDLEGTYHIVPFSSVTTVSNYMRDYGYHKGEYSISYHEDIDYATEQLRLAFEELKNSEVKEYILGDIDLAGVSDFSDGIISLRVLIQATPGYQWIVGRAYNRLVKIYFDRAGIDMAFPHRTIFYGEKKGTSTPPLNVKTMDGQFDDKGLENDDRLIDGGNKSL